MGQAVLIIGESGTGKSASLRNFERGEVTLFNVAGKQLPFKGKFVHEIVTDSYREIKKGWYVMSNLLSYKNYNGTVEYSREDECLFGKVIGIKSLLSYEGQSVQELEQDFKTVIDEYLEDCKERNIEPEQPYKGTFN